MLRDPKSMTMPSWPTSSAKSRPLLWVDTVEGRDTWSPDELWDLETIELVAAVLHHHGLRTETVQVTDAFGAQHAQGCLSCLRLLSWL